MHFQVIRAMDNGEKYSKFAYLHFVPTMKWALDHVEF